MNGDPVIVVNTKPELQGGGEKKRSREESQTPPDARISKTNKIMSLVESTGGNASATSGGREGLNL